MPGRARAAPGRRRAGRLSPEARFAAEALAALSIAAALVWAVTRWIAVPWAIEGNSMAPTLARGDRVLVDLRSYRGRDPRPGEVALLLGPGGLPIVKRVARLASRPGAPPPGTTGPFFDVLGDNADESHDSRAFGPVPRDRFVGRVVWRFWPPGRMQRIR